MAEFKHTPTPWGLEEYGWSHNGPVFWGAITAPFETEHRDQLNIVSGGSFGLYGRTVEEANANAEFIVRACNAHYRLLAACRMVLDDPGLTQSANDVIREAIDIATEPVPIT